MSTTTPTPTQGSRPQDVLERVFRQLLQTYGPSLVVALTSVTAGNSSAIAAFWTLATIALTTTVKALAKLRSKPGDPLWKVILDRAGSAFGLQLVGLGVSTWAGLIAIDWNQALTAAVAAAGLALLMYYVTPPSNPPTPVEPNADGSYTVTDVSAEDVDRAIYGDTTRPHRPGATGGEW